MAREVEHGGEGGMVERDRATRRGDVVDVTEDGEEILVTAPEHARDQEALAGHVVGLADASRPQHDGDDVNLDDNAAEWSREPS